MNRTTHAPTNPPAKLLAVVLAIVLTLASLPVAALAQVETSGWSESQSNSDASTLSAAESHDLSYDVELTFANDGVSETVAGNGYSIEGTTLSIDAAGVYRIAGSCTEGSIVVSKGLSNVVLVLDDLSLASSSTAPVVVKKSTSATIHTLGNVTLTDNEDPANETSSDADVADAFEGAAIKAKSGSSVTFCGEGTLNVVGNAKNGIKGAATSVLNFVDSDVTYQVSAANNGIAADGQINIDAGTFNIDATNDGIKAVPDADDADSVGSITINGGSFDIDAQGDGIQAETKLQINDGTFDIKTLDGYASSSFDKDTMSCKGLKASGDRDGIENDIEINGGTFTLNTADDAIHSDAYAEIYGGTFTIDTGDDGVHADTSLTLGREGSTYQRDPDITINNSYEGLEAGSVYIYQGRYYVTASDDGINAAGGSSNGFDPWQRGRDPFNPGGRPGGPGQQGGGTSASGDYSINVYGGDIYINAIDGDGYDSNGALYLYGGTSTVLSQQGGRDNSPLDFETTCVIDGATVFAAGGRGMDGSPTVRNSAKVERSNLRLSAGTVVTIKDGSGSVVYSETLPRSVVYLLYTDPTSSSLSYTTGDSVDACKSNDWAHSWDGGMVTTAATATAAGTKTFTCTSCGATETQSVPYYNAADYDCGGHTALVGPGQEDKGYNVTFATDAGVAGINVYYTHDYSSASETGVATTVSRDDETGKPDSSGSGQVNFTVVLNEGYELAGVTATSGTYKNIKGPDDTGVANTYRITKIKGDTTVTVTTTPTETPTPDPDPTPDPAPDPSPDPVAETVPMYRLYNPWSGEHLFTKDGEEYASLAELGWQQEGVAWRSPTSGAAVYRLYNPYSGDHHYTSNVAEYETLAVRGWNQEGVAFYSASEDADGAVPIYRLFNPWLTQGTHLFTTDKAEYDSLVTLGWQGEGIAFWAFAA